MTFFISTSVLQDDKEEGQMLVPQPSECIYQLWLMALNAFVYFCTIRSTLCPRAGPEQLLCTALVSLHFNTNRENGKKISVGFIRVCGREVILESGNSEGDGKMGSL